ncbi:methylenetetrahydrofolate reductase [Aeromicrobium sp. CF4.19]|uniref:methylenetetrahydrofolate reductase n=1 Tax=Aeromicrobium sp. CF4.19 TaxID=3373082 RepID=UPI003EE684B6
MRNMQQYLQSPRPSRRRGARRQTPEGRVAAAALAALLDQPRFEVLPTAGVADLVAQHLPTGRTVTVTASPTRGLEATVRLSEQLAGLGFEVVPHVAARMVTDAAELAEIVARLRAVGVEGIFVPSGDAAQAGSYPDAVSLLRALDDLGRPFTSVGITAYPESHPTISDDLTVQSMWDKHRHATEMVSNMTFDPHLVEDWLAQVRRRGVTLPLWLGLPGPVGTAQLLGVATRIGVGDSARFLIKHHRSVARLLRPDGFSTDTFLDRLAPALARDESRIAGLHLFTFNQVAETESWRKRLQDRLAEGGVDDL